MNTYTEGLCQDGAAILCNGEQLTVTEVIKRLNIAEENQRRLIDKNYECNKAWVDHSCKVGRELKELVEMLNGLQECCEISSYYNFNEYLKVIENIPNNPSIPNIVEFLAKKLSDVHGGSIDYWINQAIKETNQGI